MTDNNSNSYFLRAANNSDLPRIKNIVFGVLREYGLSPDENGKDSDLNDIERHYFQADGFFGVVANAYKSIVGTFGIYRISNEVCELRKMYLLKEVRGVGCGKMILDFAISFAEHNNCQIIRLETISRFQEAIALYKKYGFAEVAPDEVNGRVDQAFELIVGRKTY